MDLECEDFARRPPLGESLFDGFLRAARRNWHRPAVSDTTGRAMTYGRLVAACVVLRGALEGAVNAAACRSFSLRTDNGGEGAAVSSRCAVSSVGGVGGRVRTSGPAELGRPVLAIALPPGVEAVIANMTAYSMGMIPVHLNYMASGDVLRAIRDRAGFTHVLTSRRLLKQRAAALPGEPIAIEDALDGVGPLRAAAIHALLSCLPFALLRAILNPLPPGPDDVAAVVFSSGSTGAPKGVMQTHRNIRSNVEAVALAMPITADDAVAGVLPFFHSFGLTRTLWTPLLLGLRADYHSNALDPRGVGELVASRRSTILLATPTFCRLYLTRVEPRQFASLRAVIVGAEKIQPAVAEAFEARFGCPVYESYGSTELSPVIAANMPDWNLPGRRRKRSKRGTVGRPIPGVRVCVTALDPEAAGGCLPPGADSVLPPGRVGMLWVRGPSLMKGYLGEPQRTAEVLHDGWFRTGDLASVDADGFITLHGRLSRFSKIAGETVPHESVKSVMQGAAGGAARVVVTGVPDRKRGERLVVLVEGQVNPDALLAAARRADLPNRWIPRREDFFAVEALPVLGSGKLDLKRLDDLARRLAGVPEGEAS
ncbi:MAG: hypothetical protein Kow0059_15460 [Candidatus Sumerlaeia bacterium]